MKTLLITGASGFLGYNIIEQNIKNWNICALTNQRKFSFRNITQAYCNLTDEELLKNTLESIKPDAIIHLAAISDTNYCEANVEMAKEVNILASINLASYAADRSIPFIFTSTDLVFDGKKGNYDEKDNTNPLNEYGKQKAFAEKGILSINKNACVLRMPLMFGYAGYYSQSFLQPFIQNIKNNKEQMLFTDEYRSILDGKSAAKGILLALDNGWKGIYHLGGNEKISRYDFGLKVCEKYSLDKQLLIPTLQKKLKLTAARPADVSLYSNKAKSEGFVAEDLAYAIAQLKESIEV